jgi:hypothetical protein
MCDVVAVAIVDRRLQQVTARGLILNNPHRKRWGFFFSCCCRDRRSRAATGHRQGLYPRRPPHPGRPSSLCDVVAGAIDDRDPPEVARPQQVTARGFILNNPHRKRWGFFFGRLREPQRLE